MKSAILLSISLLFLWRRIDGRDRSFDYEAPEPYEHLNNVCADCNPQVEQSPDPLVSMTWNAGDSKLQMYRVFHPKDYKVHPSNVVIPGIDSLLSDNKDTSVPLTITQSCSIMLDWGVERAAWLELTSPDDLSPNSSSTHVKVQAALSEFNIPYPGKMQPLVRYGNHTYRLETNKELYEGVRFTWLFVEFEEATATTNIVPIQISNISLVAKVKPLNYTGSFSSSSKELTQAWYTGAYGVRLNMDEHFFNSILIERGDRVAIQGDGHPTMDAALVAFSPYQLIAQVLNQTDSGNHHVVDQEIMAYPLYWSLSAIDYFLASGDSETFRRLVPDIMTILDPRIQDFLKTDLDIGWFGWDDRIGNGWCFHANQDRCPREAHLAFAGLVVRVCKDFQRSLILAKMPLEAQKYRSIYQRLGRRLVNVPEWPNGLGVHAAANAINSGIPSKNETDYWTASVLNDPVTICSFSQFNQYWILQAFGNAGRMEHALASIKLCWAAPMALGKGCFWEQSSPDWVNFMNDGDVAPTLPSYCHPWSSGVTAWLSHVLGGIQPLLPGYKEFLACPYVSETYPSISSTIRTPAGEIRVNATLRDDKDGTWTYTGIVQNPVFGYFGIPKLLSTSSDAPIGRLQTVILNSTPVNLLSATKIKRLVDRDGVSLFDLSDSFTYVRLEEIVGNSTIVASYHPIKQHARQRERLLSRYAPFPDPTYPASIVGIDRDSRGDGLYVHGRDGYILLGCHNGTDVSKLPSYIQNVSVLQHGYPGWFRPRRDFVGTSTSNKSYLPNCTSPSRRALGMVGVDGIGGEQPDLNSILIHVEASMALKGPIFISLYFVAKSKTDKLAIQVMDLETLNVIAPTTAISEYEGGVWWTMKYDASLRFRLMNMEGLHLSAIGIASNHDTEFE
jgi:alpha-L-rhamnosidase